MDYKRADHQNKKDLYRRLAQMRKNNWAKEHKIYEDQSVKSHFMIQEDGSSTQHFKAKKIVKGEIKAEQKVRNRIAAQESRQRHKCYVEELEKKVKMYEDFFERQGALCKNCKQNLTSEESNPNQASMAQEHSATNLNKKESSSNQSSDQILNSFLNNQIIRIDNTEATSPFGIFFVVCLVGVLLVFSLGQSNVNANASLLANYYSSVSQLIQIQKEVFLENAQHRFNKNVIDILELQSKENDEGFQPQNLQDNFQTYKAQVNQTFSPDWKRDGDNLSSQTQLSIQNLPKKVDKEPQVLLLRTSQNGSQPFKRLKVSPDEKQGHRIIVQPSQKESMQLPSSISDF